MNEYKKEFLEILDTLLKAYKNCEIWWLIDKKNLSLYK
ncbi:hypothetical protein BMS3Abin04_02305 [bacterium BMS3Abin04]|nr:hypothetical protein BMS3Abin04_02305 [bacterium BMS3Abin04]